MFLVCVFPAYTHTMLPTPTPAPFRLMCTAVIVSVRRRIIKFLASAPAGCCRRPRHARQLMLRTAAAAPAAGAARLRRAAATCAENLDFRACQLLPLNTVAYPTPDTAGGSAGRRTHTRAAAAGEQQPPAGAAPSRGGATVGRNAQAAGSSLPRVRESTTSKVSPRRHAHRICKVGWFPALTPSEQWTSGCRP